MKTIYGFHITHHCDPSVGLFDMHYRIEGVFNFEDEDEYIKYVIGLKELHEQTFDTIVSIETFEERNEKIIDELDSTNRKK